MRLGWHIGLPGPFSLSGTVWQSKPHRRRAPYWSGELPGWKCPHHHRREDTAIECARREARRRNTLTINVTLR